MENKTTEETILENTDTTENDTQSEIIEEVKDETVTEPMIDTINVLTDTERIDLNEKQICNVRKRKRVKTRYTKLNMNRILPIHARRMSIDELLDSNDKMHSDTGIESIQRNYASKETVKMLRNVCITISTFTIAISIALIAIHDHKIIQQSQKEITDEPVITTPQTVTATAADIVNIENTKISKDSHNRPHVTATITSTSSNTWNIHATMDLILEGTDSKGEPWSGTIKNVPIDSDTENVIYDGTQLVIGALEPESTRTLSLYPNLKNNVLKGITIDKIKHVELICQDAVTTATDPTFLSSSYITFTGNLTEDTNIMSLYATVEKEKPFDMNAAVLCLSFIDNHLETAGICEEDNVSFKFGILTCQTEPKKLTKNNKDTISAEFNLNDSKATMAKVLGIIVPQQ